VDKDEKQVYRTSAEFVFFRERATGINRRRALMIKLQSDIEQCEEKQSELIWKVFEIYVEKIVVALSRAGYSLCTLSEETPHITSDQVMACVVQGSNGDLHFETYCPIHEPEANRYPVLLANNQILSVSQIAIERLKIFVADSPEKFDHTWIGHLPGDYSTSSFLRNANLPLSMHDLLVELEMKDF